MLSGGAVFKSGKECGLPVDDDDDDRLAPRAPSPCVVNAPAPVTYYGYLVTSVHPPAPPLPVPPSSPVAVLGRFAAAAGHPDLHRQVSLSMSYEVP